MTSFFRKFTWWLQRRRKEDQLREELQFHLAKKRMNGRPTGCRRTRPDWAARRDLGNVTLVQEDTRTLWTWIALEQLGAGRPLRPADDVQEPAVHRPGRTVARAWNRRQHGDLQLHGLDPVALAARVGPRVAGGGEMAQPTVHLLQIARVRDALRRRQHLPRPRRHHGGDFPVPGVRAPAGGVGTGPVQHLCLRPGRQSERHDQRRGRARQGRIRLGRLLSRARGVASSGPSDLWRRRSRRRAAGGGHQHGLQPAALWRRRRGGRSADSDQQRGVHRDRCDAVRVLRRGSRRGARGVSPHARQSAVRLRCRARIPRPELLLAPDDGTAPSRRRPRAGSGCASRRHSSSGWPRRRRPIASAPIFQSCGSRKGRVDSTASGASTRSRSTCCWRWWA